MPAGPPHSTWAPPGWPTAASAAFFVACWLNGYCRRPLVTGIHHCRTAGKQKTCLAYYGPVPSCSYLTVPAPARSGQWRRVARLRWTFTASYPTLRFFRVWGLTALANTFWFLCPYIYMVSDQPFYCLQELLRNSTGFLTTILLAVGTAFHFVKCPAICPFSFCLHPCFRSVTARAFFAHLRSIAFRFRFALSAPAVTLRNTSVFDKNLQLNDPLWVLPWPVFR